MTRRRRGQGAVLHRSPHGTTPRRRHRRAFFAEGVGPEEAGLAAAISARVGRRRDASKCLPGHVTFSFFVLPRDVIDNFSSRDGAVRRAERLRDALEIN